MFQLWLLVFLLLQSLIFFCCEQQPKLPYDEQLSGTCLIRSEKLCWTLWSLPRLCENLCSSIVLSGVWSGAVRRRSDLCDTGNMVVDPSSVCKTNPSILLLSCHMWGPWTPRWKPRPSLAPQSALLASRRTKGWSYRCVNRSQTHLDAAFTLKMSALREHHQHWNGPENDPLKHLEFPTAAAILTKKPQQEQKNPSWSLGPALRCHRCRRGPKSPHLIRYWELLEKINSVVELFFFSTSCFESVLPSCFNHSLSK